MENMAFDWKKIPPKSWPRLLLAAFIPSAIAWVGFRVVLPTLVSSGWPVLIAG